MYNEVPKVAVLLFISSDLGRYSVQRNEMHSATHRMRLSLVPKGFLNFCFHLVYLNHLHPNELGCSLLSKGSFSETKKRIEYPIARICAPSHKVQLFLLHNVIIYMFDSSRMNWDWIWLNFSNCDIIEKKPIYSKTLQHTLIQSKEYRPEIPIHEVCLITSKNIPNHSLDFIVFSTEIFLC